MNRKLLITAIVLVLTGSLVWYFLLNKRPVVTNFEECVAAGNPVMTSYPEQCIHDGKRYVQEVSDIPTSADDAPPGSIHNLPVPDAVAAVKSHIAIEENVDEGKVIILTAYEKEWTDSCLGLGGPAESCLAVITPGYEITVQVNGREQTYRTNADGSTIRAE